MRRGDRRNRGLELGVLLLMSEMFNFGFTKIPPVTLSFIVGQILLYLGVIDVPWDKWDVCISADKIINSHDYRRLVLSAFEHGDDMHLYYNMVSFLVKGSSLERRYRTMNFLILLIIITLMTSGVYVGLAVGCTRALLDNSYMKTCAIGFSGVLFALKVITTNESEPRKVNIGGLQVPSRYAAWAELFLIHFLVPNASFMGHLAGIITGVLYTSTFVGSIIDEFIRQITGRTMEHDIYYYNYDSSYNNYGSNNYDYNSYNNYGSNSYNNFGRNSYSRYSQYSYDYEYR